MEPSEQNKKPGAAQRPSVYNPQEIEIKWQKFWQESQTYKAPDQVKGKRNFYHLVMFPYPSGNLHIGHWYNFAPADVFARFKRMQGFNVMSPIGFDAFGLPAENAAIKRNIHPKVWTYQNIEKMRSQLRSMGAVYDWSREVVTCDPEYYKWTQWMFLQMYKKRLAYKSRSKANWCPACKSILANEQAEEGKCWRCEGPVEQREIDQWFFKITDYGEDLLKDLAKLDWPEKTKTMQRNWIGKSEGWEINFTIADSQLSTTVFTTRVDTLFGATHLVLAPEHPIINEIKSRISNLRYVEQYILETKNKTERERISDAKEKTGVELKGIKAVNPASNKEIPIFIADYVLSHYGTGAIMAVPAHDRRDLDFARKYNLPVIEVIKPDQKRLESKNSPGLVVSGGMFTEPYEGEGTIINSDKFNGMTSQIARERVGEWLQKKGKAKRTVYYKLKDWLISRQRYWGAPIPMIYCQKCGLQPVPEKDLPVLLPDIQDFLPSADGKSPLAKSKQFTETTCPKCQGLAERETDTMDTFVCSSWYFLRYSDPRDEKSFAEKTKIKSWLPVDMYIGGAEHTVLHLLYSRFFVKALKSMKYLDFSEPFMALRHQGMILGTDGQKMSKSRGNVVDPDEQVKKYGADVVRLYLCFMGPYDQGGPWNPKGIEGLVRFLNKVWSLSGMLDFSKKIKADKTEQQKLNSLVQKTIKKVTEDTASFRFNTSISALMVLLNEFMVNPSLVTEKHWKNFLLLLSPFAPHITEELWQRIGGEFSIHNQPWPKYSQKALKEEKVVLVIQVNGKVRDRVEADPDISEEEAKKMAMGKEIVKNWLEGKEIKKVIFVKGKLINIVI